MKTSIVSLDGAHLEMFKRIVARGIAIGPKGGKYRVGSERTGAGGRKVRSYVKDDGKGGDKPEKQDEKPDVRYGRWAEHVRTKGGRDSRLPSKGTEITRHYQGREVKVVETDEGFTVHVDGKHVGTGRSLTGALSRALQKGVSGYSFMRLGGAQEAESGKRDWKATGAARAKLAEWAKGRAGDGAKVVVEHTRDGVRAHIHHGDDHYIVEGDASGAAKGSWRQDGAKWQPHGTEYGKVDAQAKPSDGGARSGMDRFVEVYKEELARMVKEHPEKYTWSEADLPRVSAKMEAAIRAGTYNNEGDAFKAATKRLGIKHTYTAINAFLKESANPAPTPPAGKGEVGSGRGTNAGYPLDDKGNALPLPTDHEERRKMVDSQLNWIGQHEGHEKRRELLDKFGFKVLAEHKTTDIKGRKDVVHTVVDPIGHTWTMSNSPAAKGPNGERGPSGTLMLHAARPGQYAGPMVYTDGGKEYRVGDHVEAELPAGGMLGGGPKVKGEVVRLESDRDAGTQHAIIRDAKGREHKVWSAKAEPPKPAAEAGKPVPKTYPEGHPGKAPEWAHAPSDKYRYADKLATYLHDSGAMKGARHIGNAIIQSDNHPGAYVNLGDDGIAVGGPKVDYSRHESGKEHDIANVVREAVKPAAIGSESAKKEGEYPEGHPGRMPDSDAKGEGKAYAAKLRDHLNKQTGMIGGVTLWPNGLGMDLPHGASINVDPLMGGFAVHSGDGADHKHDFIPRGDDARVTGVAKAAVEHAIKAKQPRNGLSPKGAEDEKVVIPSSPKEDKMHGTAPKEKIKDALAEQGFHHAGAVKAMLALMDEGAVNEALRTGDHEKAKPVREHPIGEFVHPASGDAAKYAEKPSEEWTASHLAKILPSSRYQDGKFYVPKVTTSGTGKMVVVTGTSETAHTFDELQEKYDSRIRNEWNKWKKAFDAMTEHGNLPAYQVVRHMKNATVLQNMSKSGTAGTVTVPHDYPMSPTKDPRARATFEGVASGGIAFQGAKGGGLQSRVDALGPEVRNALRKMKAEDAAATKTEATAGQKADAPKLAKLIAAAEKHGKMLGDWHGVKDTEIHIHPDAVRLTDKDGNEYAKFGHDFEVHEPSVRRITNLTSSFYHPEHAPQSAAKSLDEWTYRDAGSMMLKSLFASGEAPAIPDGYAAVLYDPESRTWAAHRDVDAGNDLEV